MSRLGRLIRMHKCQRAIWARSRVAAKVRHHTLAINALARSNQ